MYVAGVMIGRSLIPSLLMIFTKKFGRLTNSLEWTSKTHCFITSYASSSVISGEEHYFVNTSSDVASHIPKLSLL